MPDQTPRGYRYPKPTDKIGKLTSPEASVRKDFQILAEDIDTDITRSLADAELASKVATIEALSFGTLLVNLAQDPSATRATPPGGSELAQWYGWRLGRWYGSGGGAGQSEVISVTNHPEGVTTARRKIWSAPSSTVNETGFLNAGNSTVAGSIASSAGVGVPVTPGQSVYASSWLRSNRGVPVGMYFAFRDAAGTRISRVLGGTSELTAGAWGKIHLRAEVPAGATHLTIASDVLDTTGNWSAAHGGWNLNDYLDGTGLVILKGAGEAARLDGEMPSAYWTGAPNNSTTKGLPTSTLSDLDGRVDEAQRVASESKTEYLDAERDVVWPPGLVAFWDWQNAERPFQNRLGAGKWELGVAAGSPTPGGSPGPFGPGVTFGVNDALSIPPAEVGALNVARTGDQVTVVAWVDISGTDTDAPFIGGIWDERDDKPGRNYGLFGGMSSAGDWGRVVGHVSNDGGDSEGVTWSRDHSSSSRTLRQRAGTGDPIQGFRCVAFTYDGEQVVSYLDGVPDRGLVVVEPDTEFVIHRNPLPYDEGLNRTPASAGTAEFTVGAVRLPSGWFNWFRGVHGGLAVFDRALDPREVLELHLSTRGAGPLLDLTPYLQYAENGAAKNRGFRQWGGSGEELTDANWNGVAAWKLERPGTGPADRSALVRVGSYGTNATSSALVAFDGMTGTLGLRLKELNSIRFRSIAEGTATSVRPALKIGGQWYVSAATFPASVQAWASAAYRSFLITRDPADWRLLNQDLSLGTAPQAKLPNQTVEAIGIYTGPTAGVLRVTDWRIF